MGGGVGIVPTWVYAKGLYSVWYKGFTQDPTTGEIRQQKHGDPSSVTDVIVPASLNPSPKGFAVVAWNQGALDSNPQVEIRVFWLNTSGQIFEQAFSTKHGTGATWYDGELRGDFKAAPYSSIAANASVSQSSGNPSFWVYFQEEGTNFIRELQKDQAPQYTLQPVDTKRPKGIEGTKIATGTSFSGATEIYYQVPGEQQNPKWHIDGAGEQETFRPDEEYPYTAGAPVTVVGSVSAGDALFCSVNAKDEAIATPYNGDTKTWGPSGKLVDVVGGRQIWAASHPSPYSKPSHSTTIAVSQDPDNLQDITLIGFTSISSWDILKV